MHRCVLSCQRRSSRKWYKSRLGRLGYSVALKGYCPSSGATPKGSQDRGSTVPSVTPVLLNTHFPSGAFPRTVHSGSDKHLLGFFCGSHFSRHWIQGWWKARPSAANSSGRRRRTMNKWKEVNKCRAHEQREVQQVRVPCARSRTVRQATIGWTCQTLTSGSRHKLVLVTNLKTNQLRHQGVKSDLP